MNNSDENLFWFVNFIKIKDLVINKDLLKVVNDYQYKSKTSETNVKIEITEEYVEKFKNHFQNVKVMIFIEMKQSKSKFHYQIVSDCLFVFQSQIKRNI